MSKMKQLNFNIEAKTLKRFDDIITANNYNKSAVLRGLVKDWITTMEITQ